MINRRTLSFSILAAAVLALCLPVLAAAQGGYGYPDYGRNRNGNNGRYDERYLKDSINRLDRLSKDFERDLDRALITVASTAPDGKTTSTRRVTIFGAQSAV
jgi:hypothetical protein